MSTTSVEERLTSLWETPKTARGWFSTVDHKELGIRYLVTAVIFLIVGGLKRCSCASSCLDLTSPFYPLKAITRSSPCTAPP